MIGLLCQTDGRSIISSISAEASSIYDPQIHRLLRILSSLHPHRLSFSTISDIQFFLVTSQCLFFLILWRGLIWLVLHCIQVFIETVEEAGCRIPSLRVRAHLTSSLEGLALQLHLHFITIRDPFTIQFRFLSFNSYRTTREATGLDWTDHRHTGIRDRIEQLHHTLHPCQA